MEHLPLLVHCLPYHLLPLGGFLHFAGFFGARVGLVLAAALAAAAGGAGGGGCCGCGRFGGGGGVIRCKVQLVAAGKIFKRGTARRCGGLLLAVLGGLCVVSVEDRLVIGLHLVGH